MSTEERRKYLRRMQKRYLQADRKEHRRLLDEWNKRPNCTVRALSG